MREPLSEKQKQSLWEQAASYHKQLPGSPASDYLTKRGLSAETSSEYGLGYCAEKQRLSIPYLRLANEERSVATIKFRCVIPDCSCADHPKYTGIKNSPVGLFNTVQIQSNHDIIAVCEGEIDAITASSHGIPAVGVPGVESWKPHFSALFRGYRTVFVLADGDEPGYKFAEGLASKLNNTVIIPALDGEDVNSEITKYGPERLQRKVAQ